MVVITKIGAWLTAKYDKLIALAVFIGLVVSLGYLALRIGMIKRLDQQFERELEALTAAHPEAAQVTSESYDLAMAQVLNPTSLSVWTNDLTVPELRVWCTDCRRPIRFKEQVCPFCGTQQQGDVDWVDSDNDGISDGDEETLGLDPRDPDDAGQDLDGDLFSNLDEFRAGTDLGDPKDYPAIEPFIVLAKIDAIPFKFLFKSYMKGRKDAMIFAVNTRDGGRTHFLKLGEEVEGFTLHGFEKKIIENPAGPNIDQSVLTLKREDRLIPLTKGADVKYDEYTVYFEFTLDKESHVCKLGGKFKLRDNREYELIKIDSAQRNVVIRRLNDDEEFVVAAR